MAARAEWDAERIARLLPKAKKSPNGWKACCPAHDDSNPSLFLADGRDGVAMVCYAGCTYRQIADALALKGVEFGPRKDAEGYPTDHYQLGQPHNQWEYRDKAGNVIMLVCRWNQPNGRKDIRPLVRTADGWKWQHHPTPRPLYNLDQLANEPERPVYVLEGEKAAAAAQKLFPAVVATTWPGGAQSVGQADWTSLAGRDVTLVPDCDEPGRQAMRWVAKALSQTAKRVRIVDPSTKGLSLPDGWDLADAGVDRETILSWFVDAPAEPVLIRHPLAFSVLGESAAPSRTWAIDGWLGKGHVTLLAGPPGAGKTALAQSLSSCLALGVDVLGNVPKPLKCLVWAGEDDHDELWRRQEAICRWLGQPLAAFSERLILEHYHDRDLTLAGLANGVLCITELMSELREQIADYQADVVFVDSIAKVFGGNENDRHQVTKFVTALCDALAPTNAALCLLGHPSKAVGSEWSGSTAWEASCRSRWYFGHVKPGEKPEIDIEEQPDADQRWLAKRKANYSARELREVRWVDGCMRPAEVSDSPAKVGSFSPQFLADEALRLFRELKVMGIDASNTPQAANYLPKAARRQMLIDPRFTEKDIRVGLAELMKVGRLKIGPCGQYGNRTPKIGLVEP